jgi:NAD(P)-dependent dehydrogenase (short-subunit alcohol dehydrogenase family)
MLTPGLTPGLFEGRTALVTGGGSGIGEAIAGELARLGASVALAGRRQERLDDACAAITDTGGVARGYAVDVRDRDRVEQVVASVEEDLGPVDHLVNCAAGNFRVAPEGMSPNAWDAVVQIVLYGTWNCTQVVGRRMIAAGRGGSMLNIGSTMSTQGGPDTAHSASAKAGTLALTKSLGGAWGKYGIRVNTLTPGATEGTPGVEALFPGQGTPPGIPLGRLATRAEVATMAAFMLSDAAAYLTGAEVVLDGGRSLGRT